MQLNLESLEIKNFKSFVGEVAHVDFNAYGPGLHFLRGRNDLEPRLGSNGAGKSSLLDAIVWCWFGRTPDGLRNPDIIPWNSKEKSYVSTIIKLDDKRHTITRYANPNGLYLDGKTTDQDSIDKLLCINFDTFIHTILLAQDQPLFYDLPPRQKLDLFTSVLNLDRWDTYSSTASSKTNELQHKESELTGELNSFDARQAQIEAMLAKARSLSEEWASTHQEHLTALESQLIELAGQETSIQKRHDTANLAYDGACTELRAIEREKAQLETYLTSAKEEQREAQNKITLDQRLITRAETELKDLGDTDTCPTCGQSIQGTDLDKHINEIKGQIAILQKRINRGIPNAIISSVKNLSDQLDKLKTDNKALYDKATKARESLDFLIPELANVTAKIKQLKISKEKQFKEENPYLSQIQDLRRQRTKLKVEKEDVEKQLRTLAKQIARTHFWVKGFKDVRLFIIEEVLTELELTTNIMLQDVGLEDWSVKYDIERETKSGSIQRGLNVFIQSPRNDKPVKFESWSGGEGQRLRLIGALALSEVLLNHAGVHPSIEILDEPSRSLSSKGIRELVDFLAERAVQLGKTILLVDHHSVESDRFASVTTIVKDANGSYIE